MVEHRDDVSAAWDEHAAEWVAWARTLDHDVYYWQLNFPAFAEIIPPPGRRTLDVGCGEGRIGRWLADHGHRVAGLDSSSALAASARQAGGYQEVVCADAAAMPWPDNEFDAAIAFMSLHDMASPADAISEIARVIEPGAALSMAIVHPLNRPAERLEHYFTEQRFSDSVTRDGLTMTFHGIDRPLEGYIRPLSAAGFVIEQLLEPHATSAGVKRAPRLAPAADKPHFLHLACRLTAT